MKKLSLCTAISAAAFLLSHPTYADSVKGSAKADFNNDELIVPCVQIEGYSDAADGTYFDLIFDRRGNSFNYELKFGEIEDAAVCEEIANYAVFIDDDPEDDVDEDDEDDDDSSDDDDSDSDDDSDDATDVANLFASCEVRHESEEQTRSRIKVKARDLVDGEYYAIVSSGDNVAQSEPVGLDDDEVEIEFDSDADDVLEGATEIDASFIVGESVTADIVDAGTDKTILTETVSCLVENKNS